MNLLFLCTGNSCRSQMAEGWAKAVGRESDSYYSAGTETHGLNTRAVQVMKEIGIDISQHESNNISEFDNIKLDLVVTVCSNAEQSCPTLIGTKVIHKGFDDPPTLTKDMENEEEILKVYRNVRDQIGEYIKSLIASEK